MKIFKYRDSEGWHEIQIMTYLELNRCISKIDYIEYTIVYI